MAAIILISLCPGSRVLPREDVYFYQGNPISTHRVGDASKGQFSGISHVLLKSGLPEFVLPISRRFMPNKEIHLISIVCSATLATPFQSALVNRHPGSFSPRLFAKRSSRVFVNNTYIGIFVCD